VSDSPMLYRPPQSKKQTTQRNRTEIRARLELKDAFEFLAELGEDRVLRFLDLCNELSAGS